MAKSIDIVKNKLKQLKETVPYFHKYGLIFSLFVAVDIIVYQLKAVHYYLIVMGEEPYVGITGLLLMALLYYIWFVLFVPVYRATKISKWLAFIVSLLPTILVIIYCDIYSNYSDNLEKEYLKQSHKCVGMVY